MNNLKVENEQQDKPETVALLDCGKASEVTKGTPYYSWFEFGPPPYNTTLLW